MCWSPTIQQTVRRMLVRGGLRAAGRRARTVPGAQDGEQALQSTDGGKPANLVISDYNMPKLDGILSLLHAVRDYPPTTE